MGDKRLRHVALLVVVLVTSASCVDVSIATPTAPAATTPAATAPAASPTSPATPTAAPASTLPSPSAPVSEPPSPTITPASRPSFTSVNDAYHQAPPAWLPCTASGVAATCATVYVPTVYEQPGAGTTAIALARFAAQGTSEGDLFVNPGGPGESGIGLAAYLSSVSALAQSFDIVGFDPRGTGQSDPLVCLGTAALDQLIGFDPTPDTPAERQQGIDLVTAQGQACQANSGLLAAHVTTVETARDMDVMRSLLGDDKMDYLGFSYGTFLGTTYAALFPDKVGRMVLDGALLPGLSNMQIAEAQTSGLQREFEQYFTTCVGEGQQCPLGTSVAGAGTRLRQLFVDVDASPLPTNDPARPLDQALAFYGVIAPMYSPAQWWVLDEALQGAFSGNGQTLLGLADVYLERNADGYATNAVQANQAITCLDEQVAGGPTSIPKSTFVADSPIVGDIMFGLADRDCGDWPLTTTIAAPDYSAPGTPPILVVGTTRDPVTPYSWARQLADTLHNGVLLTRVGDGHTAYLSGNQCIVNNVDAFLVNGALPATGTRC